MQWLQDQNKSNVDNLNNVNREVSKHFRNKIINIFKLKLMNLKQAIRLNVSEICTGTKMTKKR